MKTLLFAVIVAILAIPARAADGAAEGLLSVHVDVAAAMQEVLGGGCKANCTFTGGTTLTRVGIGVAAGGSAELTLAASGTITPASGVMNLGSSNLTVGTTGVLQSLTNAGLANFVAFSSAGSGSAQFASGAVLGWNNANAATAASPGTLDTGLFRIAARQAGVSDGGTTNLGDLATRSLGTGTAMYGSAPIGTVGSGTGITVNATGDVRDVVNKVTLTNAAFSAAATTADATIYTLAAKQKLVDIYADVTQVFSGGAVSAATMTCGITAGGNTLLVSFDVKTATIQRGLADADLGTALTRATAIQGGYMPSWSATTAISCRMTTVTANTNALTQGSVTFYLTTRAF